LFELSLFSSTRIHVLTENQNCEALEFDLLEDEKKCVMLEFVDTTTIYIWG
jgi:hypothetical protein